MYFKISILIGSSRINSQSERLVAVAGFLMANKDGCKVQELVHA